MNLITKKVVPESEPINSTISVLKLITILGSIITLTTSAIKAKIFSDYYGVQFNNFDFMSTTQEMVVIVGPVILLICLFRIFFVLTFGNTKYKRTNAQEFYECSIIALTGFLYGITILFYCHLHPIFSKIPKIIYPFAFIAIIFAGLFIYDYKIKKGADDNNSISAAVAVFIFIVSGAMLFFTLWHNMSLAMFPNKILTYEITKSSETPMVVICNNEQSKLVLECDIDEEENTIYIHHGKYKYIKPENYTFEFVTFDKAECDNEEYKKNSISFKDLFTIEESETETSTYDSNLSSSH